ncbi:MAG: hypothetical protein HY316_10180 [Acidobacteria bacterium]|nr:hypothetical protein [Acidobacteriota bacterium]
MRNLGRLSTVVALVGFAGVLALASSPADANSPVEVKVVAEQKAEGPKNPTTPSCPKCKLDLFVSGAMIDQAAAGFGNLTGTAEFKNANGVETTLNFDRSEMIGTDGSFIMIRLTDTAKPADQPRMVDIRLMPGSPIVRVRNGAGILVEYSSGEYSAEIELE